jgi:hypothetical protein
MQSASNQSPIRIPCLTGKFTGNLVECCALAGSSCSASPSESGAASANDHDSIENNHDGEPRSATAECCSFGRSPQEREAALRAVAGNTDFGKRQSPETSTSLRRRGIVMFPADLGIAGILSGDLRKRAVRAQIATTGNTSAWFET